MIVRRERALTTRMTSLALVMLLHGTTPGVMVNPICVLDGLVNGFGHPNGLPP